MSDQRRRRWADVVQMLYKRFVFAGIPMNNVYSYNARAITGECVYGCCEHLIS